MSDLIPGTPVQADMAQTRVMTEVSTRLDGLIPKDDMVFPAGDLGDTPEHELSAQLGYWTQMAGWMVTEVAWAENRRSVAEAQLDRVKAKAFTATTGQATHRKNEAEADVTVGEANIVFLIEAAVLRILRATADRYEKNYFAISREMTRRQKSMEMQLRNERFGGD